MKGNRLQYCLSVLLAGCLLGYLPSGCTAGPVEEIVPEEIQPVLLRFGKPDLGVPAVLTRADGDEADPTLLPRGTTVRICAYFTGDIGGKTGEASFSTMAPSFEATYVVGADGSLSPCVVDADGRQTAGEAKGLLVRGGVYDFYAVSPARPLVKTDGYYRVTGIAHKEDVMTSFVRGVPVGKDSRIVTLGTFRRKCALVVFNVAPWPGNALPMRSLYGTKLELKGIPPSGASLVAGEETGIPLSGGSGDEARVVFNEDEFEPVEEDSDPGGIGLNKTKGILIPKDNSAFDVEIAVVRNDETASLKATIDKNISFVEGKRYVFTLEVRNEESRLVMRVIEWNAVYFTDNNVGAPDEPYPDPDVNEGIGTSIVVAQWKDIQWSGNGEIGGSDRL